MATNSEKQSSSEKQAHIREFFSSNQCELTFTLNTKDKEALFTNEEIRAVRQLNDTVGSLFMQIRNFLNKVLNSKRPEEQSDEEIDIPIALFNKNSKKEVQDNVTLKQLLSMKNMTFQIFEEFYQVFINAPLVKKIKLPDIIYVGYPVQPAKFHAVHIEQKLTQYFWYKSIDKIDWIQLNEESCQKYLVEKDDAGFYLKLVCLPCNKRTKGPKCEAVSDNTIEIMGELPHCPFMDRHKETEQKLTGNTYRIVSYNVLSFRYTHSDQFLYCLPKYLAMDYRKQLISKELLGYNADIICLQELDSSAFTSYYNSVFKKCDYMSFYHKKGNRIPEGLCCMINTKRLKKIDCHQLVYSEAISNNKLFGHLLKVIKSDVEVKECFFKQMTSLQVTVMKARDTNNFFIIGNTHLFYHPEAEHIRLIQIVMATTYLDSLRKSYYTSRTPVNVSVIIVGDFNSNPDSSVIEFMLNGRIEKDNKVWTKIKRFEIFHNFMLESACGFPKYTNYTDDFKDCLDYIFIERNQMQVTKSVSLPSENELGKHEGLPNQFFPSDHLALIAQVNVI